MSDEKTPITAQIEKAVAGIPGWTPPDQLLSLFMLACGSSDAAGDILELGSWCGRSAVVLGTAARLCGGTKVHCVDLFPAKTDWYANADGTYSFAVEIDGRRFGAHQEQTVWAEPFEKDVAPIYDRYPGTLDAFRENIARNHLEDWVIPYRTDFSAFPQLAPPDLSLRMAFVDGDHSFEGVCRDIALVEHYLRPGGWICFDDAHSAYDGVDRAIAAMITGSGKYARCQQLTRKLFVAQFLGHGPH